MSDWQPRVQSGRGGPLRQPDLDRAVLDAAPDRDRGVSAEALGVPRPSLLELRTVAQPYALAVVGLDAADRGLQRLCRLSAAVSRREHRLRGARPVNDPEAQAALAQRLRAAIGNFLVEFAALESAWLGAALR